MAASAKKVAGKQKSSSKESDTGEGIPLRPGQCRAYMRRTLAGEFKGIVDGFVKKAKSGNCQHVKLATELLETKQRRPSQSKGRQITQHWLREVEAQQRAMLRSK